VNYANHHPVSVAQPVPAIVSVCKTARFSILCDRSVIDALYHYSMSRRFLAALSGAALSPAFAELEAARSIAGYFQANILMWLGGMC
jgi:hypothetical protein